MAEKPTIKNLDCLATSSSNSNRSIPILLSIAVLTFSLLLFYYLQLGFHNDPPANNLPLKLTIDQDYDTIGQSQEPLTGSGTSSIRDIMMRKPFTDFISTKETLNHFNRLNLLPLIKSLVTMDYFRYVKVNLNRPCELWCNADKCNLRDCGVKPLTDPSKCPMKEDDDDIKVNDEELSFVNTELDSGQLDLLIKLFECNDSDDHDSEYVDLLLNPERYTGYSGESANRIWRAIYEENCFIRKTHSPFSNDLCYEERLFYEAISGLHSSINIHLCAEYPTGGGLMGTFEPNLDEFLRRFGEHNDYLENLYTLFQLELRALALSKPYLLRRVKWPETSTKEAVHDLLKTLDKVDLLTFKDLSLKPSHVSHELATHFRNITTTIIDCVSCDKCKLWGKVQLRGLGTAFKILSIKDLRMMNLNHQEIVSLINAIARLSHSIKQLEKFRDLFLSRQAGNNDGQFNRKALW